MKANARNVEVRLTKKEARDLCRWIAFNESGPRDIFDRINVALADQIEVEARERRKKAICADGRKGNWFCRLKLGHDGKHEFARGVRW
jgi:hypothetical protein